MIELLNCDCMEYMKGVPNKFFDLAIVDPPYGIERFQKNVESKAFKTFTNKINGWDKKPIQEYFEQLFRISKNQIIWGVNHFWKVNDSYCLPNCPSFIFWDKKVSVDNFASGELAWSSFNGVAKKFEYAWGGLNDGIVGRNKTEKSIHPTQKPVKLYKWLLKNYAKEGDKIFDSHGGSMSIAIACHDMTFDLVCCEIDKDYYEAGVKRYKDHLKQLTLF